MANIRYKVEPSFEFKNMPGWVQVTLKNGVRLEHRIDKVKGDASHPIQREELLEKFYGNTVGLGREKSQRIAEHIFEFARIDKMNELMRELI